MHWERGINKVVYSIVIEAEHEAINRHNSNGVGIWFTEMCIYLLLVAFIDF